MTHKKEPTDVAKREEKILDFWQKNHIFEKSEAKESPKGEFVFYDGPPFATGLPHYGHILAGTIKDAIPRYKTMRGYRVRRKWGWDCHGLPLENLIEKELGLKNKKDIEEIGVGKFNEAARKAVLRYADDWRKIIPRMGRWADMDRDYKTMDASYSESVWWIFKTLYDKELIYEGYKSMHLCPRCGTTLSNFEVAQGYADITDFAVTVKLPLKDEPNTYLLVWTTTPWTLPGNMAAAVNAEEDYVKIKSYAGMPIQIESSKGKNEETRRTSTTPGTYVLAKDVFWRNIQGDAGFVEIRRLFKDLDKLKQDTIKFASNPEGFFKEYENQIEVMKGAELVGKSYVPPFPYFVNTDLKGKENAWKIYHAPYVSLGEGTGAVHLAPAFGAEDMELAQMYDIPIVHHVKKDGTFSEEVKDFAGMPVKPKDTSEDKNKHQSADIEIIKYLAHHNLLFAKEKIVHSYPLCWRCDTPLLNYAAGSWFVKVSALKDKLLKENARIRWVPASIGMGRFHKGLETAPDWAISRSRYWGAPLPVWKNEKTGAIRVMGSVQDLKQHTKCSGNTYFLMRHGEATFNTENKLSSDPRAPSTLTDEGAMQVKKTAQELKEKDITTIYYSPVLRTKETAQLIQRELGLPDKNMHEDARLREVSFGEFEGKTIDEYHASFATPLERFTKRPEGGETWSDVKRRVTELLYDIEQKHTDEHILMITHNGPLQMLQAGAYGLDQKKGAQHIGDNSFDFHTGEWRVLPFIPLPHNEDYELDLHRPYIDDIELVDHDGEPLMRIPDVFDCWFESGSMPYAQQHYPFENTDTFEPKRSLFHKSRGYPADFIAESVDQTRGWFYSLIVLGVALFERAPYKNVITNGLVLAEDGKKMSKRLKNYPDPVYIANTYGADALRYYLLSSTIMRGEDLNFSEKGVKEVMRKNIVRLANVYAFYALYASERVPHGRPAHASNVLDRWILARLDELVSTVTEHMERYELDKACRPLADFIDDLSTWYLRRSRERFKGDGEEDKKCALQTTRFVLTELSKLLAPFMPFYAEALYRDVRAAHMPESVHLDAWPHAEDTDTKLLKEMADVRSVISQALEMRASKGIKVRQPLARLSIGKEFADEYKTLIRDEANIKEVVVNTMLGESVGLDTEITLELKEEGVVRDVMRHVQELRKEKGLTPKDTIELVVETDDRGKAVLEKFEEEIKGTVLARGMRFEKNEGSTLERDDYTFTISITAPLTPNA